MPGWGKKGVIKIDIKEGNKFKESVLKILTEKED